MDALTHVFLPLTAIYVLRPALFAAPARFLLSGFGLLPDADKLIGQPGLLHSLVTLVALSGCLFVIERRLTGGATVSLLVAAFLGSHLVLDILDGGPVPLLFPLVGTGVGFRYPATAAFGEGPLGVTIHGSLVANHAATPRSGFHEYGFINGFGVASVLLFITIALGRRGFGGDSG